MPEQQLTIRGLDVELWRRVRAEAVRRGVPAGQLLNEILRNWLDEQIGAGQGNRSEERPPADRRE